jgi:hypothetical protein
MDEVRVNEVSISSSRTNSPHSPSHHHRTPTPLTPRNEPSSWRRHSKRTLPTFSLLVLIFLTCCISLSSASNFYIDEQMIESIEAETSEDLGSALARLAKSGTILVDQGPPPNPKAWTLATEHDDLQRRAAVDPSSSSSSSNDATSVTSSSTSMITTASTTATRSGTKTSSIGIAVATTASSSPLPSPFDQGFSGNITDSCQAFMNGMLTNATFKSCLPFSLLLQVRLTPCPFHLPFHHQLTTNISAELQLLLPSLQIPRPHLPNPRRNMRRQSLNLHTSHVIIRLKHHHLHSMRLRSLLPESPHNPSASRSPRI